VVRPLVDFGAPELAMQMVSALAGWFPKVYVELMDHGFKADGMWDGEIVDQLVWIAEQLGLPTILTGDTHYTVHRGQGPARRPQGAGHLVPVTRRKASSTARATTCQPTSRCDEKHPYGWEGLADLASRIKVKIPELDTFSLKIPDVTFGKDADVVLEGAHRKALAEFSS
jgi:DNA polymerase III alpha subunit